MKVTLLALLAFTVAYAQESGLTARELYYSGTPAADATPGKPAVAPKAAPKTDPKPAQKAAARPTSGNKPNDVRVVNAALRLGLRYNILLIDDRKTGRSHEVDPDRSFKSGECFQVKLRPNRSGLMYVFNHGSSGEWHTLLPSAQAPGESREVTANAEVLVPRDYCIELDDRKGKDTLVIAISDRPDDIKRLDEPAPAPLANDGLLAMRRVTSVMGEPVQMVSRDMTIQKLGASTSSSEPPNSVFVVKNSPSATDRLVIEIPLRHD